MASDDDQQQRYGRNRNLWRKVYSYNKQKPRNFTIVDETTSRSLDVDLNQLYRHRDYFKIDKIDLQPTGALNFVEYDEGLIYFGGETYKTGGYNFNFSGNPFVVYTREPTTNNYQNVNVFGLGLPTYNQFIVGTSAPFSGSVRYRAVYSPFLPGYLGYVVHNPGAIYNIGIKCNSPYTASFAIWAGDENSMAQYAYTASYFMPSGSVEYRDETHDAVGDMSSDVALINQTLTTGSSTNIISAQLTNRIHWMVTTPGPTGSLPQYDEGLINFNGETELTGTYNFVFTNPPFVVFTSDPALDNSDNVNPFGLSVPGTASFTVGVSAPFTGSVRYRAVYSPSYPAAVTSFYTGSLFYVAAGDVNGANITDYTASYSAITNLGVLEVRSTAHDALGSGSSDVLITNDTLSTTLSTNSISAPLTNRIHFIVASTVIPPP